MKISEMLKSMRIESGLTQKELSERLKIGQATITCYETGRREPHISGLIAYADYFECSVDYLLGRADDYGNIVIADDNKRIAVSNEEREFLLRYRALDDIARNRLFGYLDAVSEKPSDR